MHNCGPVCLEGSRPAPDKQEIAAITRTDSLLEDAAFEFSPIVARTRAHRGPIAPMEHDCVQLILVRDGSARACSEFGEATLNVGDVVILGGNVLYGMDPDPQITVTTICVDTDYALDQLYWQYVGVINNRLDVKEFADTIYTEPAQILHLGEERTNELTPWIDELVKLSADSRAFSHRAIRMQALWFLILDIVAPHVHITPFRISPRQRARAWPTQPRHRRFSPLRREAVQAAEMIKGAIDRQWNLNELASAAHLSPSRFSDVFVDAFGKTPHACLTMLRIETMAKLLRDTDDSIESVLHQVGWKSRGHAARVFRQATGMTPSRYRALNRFAR